MTKAAVDTIETASNEIQTSRASVLLQTLALTMVMDGEANALCGAGYGERSGERRNQRNGCRERPPETTMGTLDLRIPKLREGSSFPSFLEPRRRWEQAFVSVVSEAYILGVSTRKVDELSKAMGAGGLSKSEVSRLCVTLDEEVKAFQSRKLEQAYPHLWLDALYLKVRAGRHVVSKATLLAYGVSESGAREVIGVEVADGEMEDAWRSFLSALVARGLRGVQLLISDAHQGLVKGMRSVLDGAVRQRCTVHFMRNVLCRIPKAAQGLVAAALQGLFAQGSKEAARQAPRNAVELLRPKPPAAAAIVEAAEEDVRAYRSFPEKHWRQLHSTNPLERQNKEIRRSTDLVGIFPNRASALRLVTMLLVEQSDGWAVNRRYFSAESMQFLLAAPQTTPERAVLEAA